MFAQRTALTFSIGTGEREGGDRELLFLSGWTLSSLMWGYQMEPLARGGYRCVAYDRRAHGRSSDPGRGYDFDTLADDLAAVIDTLNLTGVVVVAHSFASGEIVRYLTRYGSARIAGVVMVAPAAIPFLVKADNNPTALTLRQWLPSDPNWRRIFPGGQNASRGRILAAEGHALWLTRRWQ
jgi:non-heme chloroperoxidase